MNPQQIMDEIKEAQNQLTRLNQKLFRYGEEKEYTEQRYRIELSKKLLELRMNKCTASIVNDVARGDETISGLKLKRGLAENKYTVCKEALNNKRLELECLRSLLTWQRVELKNT
ncbi:hypothetical protein [Clostridium butyricum]|uniref:Uncharacterized protein n=1 Tax=Clostridium butyricum E4 str. BoNT E BL5262 TaxID=632245 RepID=C4IGU3_CLOBU|nr:hypothetical protein [Clostridium butyricum]EDT74795.1 conserved hypothetical protein [Clostridium butyricum 5521]EEP54638.1 conserved hypothetical protein [Clostridium butyricum E4 str. BoNT E BL5262]NFL30509.1 hypothetical protein [Clostridium butyricum]NFS19464.1 hypothetical protein [Clostridium butyricum]